MAQYATKFLFQKLYVWRFPYEKINIFVKDILFSIKYGSGRKVTTHCDQNNVQFHYYDSLRYPSDPTILVSFGQGPQHHGHSVR